MVAASQLQMISEVVIKDSASATADRVAAALDKLKNSEAGVQDTTVKSSRAIEQSARSFEALKRSVDDSYAKQQRLADIQVKLQRDVALGTASQDEANKVLQQQAAALNVVLPGMDKLSQSFKLSYTNVEILRSGMINTVQSIAAGMDPIQTLTTQLFQTAPAFGEVATKVGLAGTSLVTVGAIAGGLAVGLGILGAACYQGAKQAEAFQHAQILTANAAGLTAGSLDAIVSSATQVSTIGAGAARSIATEMAATGKFSASLIGQLTSMTADYAAATGESVSKAGQDLTKLFSDPQQAMKQLDDQYGLLSVAQRRHIDDLIEQGDKTRAQSELADHLNDRIKNLSTDGLGLLARAWNAVSGAASSAWDSMTGIGRGQTIEEHITELQGKLSRAGNPYGGRFGGPISDNPAAIQGQIDALKAILQSQSTVAGIQANQADFHDAGVQIQGLAQQYDNFGDQQRKLNNEIDAGKKHLQELSQLMETAKHQRGTNDLLTQYREEADLTSKAINGASAALKAMTRPDQAARDQLAITRSVNALPPSQRGPAQAYQDALYAAQHGDAYSQANAGAIAEAARAKAIEQQSTALRDRNSQIELAIKLTNDAAAAWAQSDAAGKAADANREATLGALTDGYSAAAEQARLLAKAASDALEQGQQQLNALNQQVGQQESLAAAAGKGRGAEHDQSLANQIDAQTRSLRNALANTSDSKVASGLRSEIEGVTAALIDADQAARQLDINHSLQQQADQTKVLKAQLDTLRLSNDERSIALARTQALIDLDRMHVDANSTAGQQYVKGAEDLARMNDELTRQKAISAELPGFFDQAFDRIGSGLTQMALQTGDALTSLRNLGASVLSELAQEALKLAAINPLKNWMNGDSALPTIGSIFSSNSGFLNSSGYRATGAGPGASANTSSGGWLSSLLSFGSSIASWFADGGIMTSHGSLPLRTYSAGGVTSSPQLAMFGEGSTPEAYVPVPSGKIPVELRGGGSGRGDININAPITVTGSAGSHEENKDLADQIQKQVVPQMKQLVYSVLTNEMRNGGMLNRGYAG